MADWTALLEDGDWPAWLRTELDRKREVDSFGAVDWAPQPRMTAAELLDEVEWLLDGGVHPLMICQQLGRSVSAVHQAARRAGRDRVVVAFNPPESKVSWVRETRRRAA
ncbi:hypothetical protein [Agromyces sp. SYSU T00194]|uniref:hypothetical protein n=1 Tax=Agromyces chitinivorans TaxID=3158560 RepID=UPI00339B7DEB